jgi:hypothetical protein
VTQIQTIDTVTGTPGARQTFAPPAGRDLYGTPQLGLREDADGGAALEWTTTKHDAP